MRDLKTCLKMAIFNIFEIPTNGRMRIRTKNMHFLTFGTSLHSFGTPYPHNHLFWESFDPQYQQMKPIKNAPRLDNPFGFYVYIYWTNLHTSTCR